ncbi:MAG: AraC family transcriptional regulator [Bacteroidota bacterium]
MNTETIFESNHKKFGLHIIDKSANDLLNRERFNPFIKVLLLPAGYSLKVDFQQYHTDSLTLFFINSNQYFQLENCGEELGYFMFYNRDFYCVQIHDAEVACDGLLFNNIYNMPMVVLPESEKVEIELIGKRIHEELCLDDVSQEEMIRVYLKLLIIRATRIWKKQQLEIVSDSPNDIDFFRNFSRLVEIHYKEKHSVADYADLLNVAPKTLTHRFKRLNLSQPNEIIKDRIILEAKRLLIYTSLTAKEIAYQLGYEDPAYFNRTFVQKVSSTTSDFRKNNVIGK